MEQKRRSSYWRCSGKTVQGASHVRVGLPNQDALWWSPESGLGPPLILAISDGHGSAKSFRSHIGANFAVQQATKQIKNFVLENNQRDRTIVQKQLPKIIVSQWLKAVNLHIQEVPFTHEEWALLEKKEGATAREAVVNNPSLAYGATLLAVVVTEEFILYLQLGDGDILCVDSYGKTTRPFALDQRLIANQTTSLCIEDAWREVRVQLVLHSENSPLLILVSTDGYSNSFRSETDFLQIGQDYQEMIRSRGIDFAAQQLPNILNDTSQQGSGDDITLGIIERIETGDADYIESVAAQAWGLEESHKSLEASMIRNQEEIQSDFSDVATQMQRLKHSQKKYRQDVTKLFYGLSVTFFLATGSVAAGILQWLQIHRPEIIQTWPDWLRSPLQFQSKPTAATLQSPDTTPSPQSKKGEKAK